MKRYDHKYYTWVQHVQEILTMRYNRSVLWSQSSKHNYMYIVVDIDVLDSKLIGALRD